MRRRSRIAASTAAAGALIVGAGAALADNPAPHPTAKSAPAQPPHVTVTKSPEDLARLRALAAAKVRDIARLNRALARLHADLTAEAKRQAAAARQRAMQASAAAEAAAQARRSAAAAAAIVTLAAPTAAAPPTTAPTPAAPVRRTANGPTLPPQTHATTGASGASAGTGTDDAGEPSSGGDD